MSLPYPIGKPYVRVTTGPKDTYTSTSNDPHEVLRRAWKLATAHLSEDERAYVSRLWATDWDSAEDAVYDDPAPDVRETP